ncbi:hypothetical protein Hamer_G013923 [Homarus americanus]|uniref:Uncharacterized protein n=1 Tax=Homarus americanus TaxID=6706 RepID=A0A8J5KIK9_HOMAM|nr:hypothetical protein Hamer_G013910 [Homarus americanus]KAG7171118.1 hypothetical protein Hamer_G013923 [Homarus americanus]
MHSAGEKDVLYENRSGGTTISSDLTNLGRFKRDDRVVPDFPTIYQALFNKPQVPTSNHMFLVKLPKQPTRKEVT